MPAEAIVGCCRQPAAFCQIHRRQQFVLIRIHRIAADFSLFKTRFYDEEIGTLREFFGPAWEVLGAYRSGRLDPGHMAEWTWLITRYEHLTGSDFSNLTSSLMRTATKLGRKRTAPFLVDEMSFDGVPLVDRRRLWPRAELLKAYIVQGYAEADELAAALLETYLADPPQDMWRDAFDLAGNVTAMQIPGSSLYHLWTTVAETFGQLKGQTARSATLVQTGHSET